MALSITHLGLNEINNHVDGRTSLPIIIDNADLNSNDVRVWGNANHGGYDTFGPLGDGGSAAAGINTTAETEISMGEFRNAEAPTAAFSGTMTSAYNIVYSGDQYIPNTYNSGYLQSVRGSHTNTTFTGTIGGRYGTHTLTSIQNTGLGINSGLITFQIQNTSGAYNSSATDWSKLVVGSYNFNRTDASSTYAGGSSSYYYYYNATWGRYYPFPANFYSLSTYFGTTSTNYTSYIDL